MRQFQSVFHQNNTWTRVIKAIRESRTDCISFDSLESSLAISETDRIKLLTSLGINMTLLASKPTIIKAPACIWRNGKIWLYKYNQLNKEAVSFSRKTNTTNLTMKHGRAWQNSNQTTRNADKNQIKCQQELEMINKGFECSPWDQK